MNKHEYLSQMQSMWSQCQGCMLCEQRTNVVFGTGNPDAQLLIVGEAPGFQEDEQGLPFVGSAGQLLDQYLCHVAADPRLVEISKKIGEGEPPPTQEIRNILLEGTYYTNVVACRPPDNRNPTPKEIQACRARLNAIIYMVDPALIIGLGGTAVETLTGSKGKITQRRGQVIDVDIPGWWGPVRYPVLAILHPSYLLRQNDFDQEGGMSDKTYYDFLRGMKLLDEYNWLHYGIKHPAERPKED